MNNLKWLKHFIPRVLLRKIRFARIIYMQKKCATDLNWLVEGEYSHCISDIRPLKKMPHDQKIIWQYWAQGGANMPDLVKVCLKSVEKHTLGYKLLRISDENLDEYLEIPDWLKSKKKTMSNAHFADLLRCVLLSVYGGVWLDASVFLTGDIPEYVFDSAFFIYRRDDSEKNKRYWEDTFAYYFSWFSDFSVKSLIGIMYADKSNETISDFALILLRFWENNNYAPDYFFFQILMEEYFKRHPESMPEIVNDTIPHLLRQYINGNPVPGYSFSDILQKTTVHSLNYKNDVACENLLTLFPEYRRYLN